MLDQYVFLDFCTLHSYAYFFCCLFKAFLNLLYKKIEIERKLEGAKGEMGSGHCMCCYQHTTLTHCCSFIKL